MTAVRIVVFVILSIGQPSAQYRQGRSLFEKRIEDVFWQSLTSCQNFRFCLNGRIRSWISTTSQNVREICDRIFKNDRWGCRVDSKTFNKVTKETATMYALLASALALQASVVGTRNYSLWTNYTNETYTENDPIVDRMELGMNITKTYLAFDRANEAKDHHLQARIHNAVLGLKVVERSIIKSCSCHGFSGSCSLKTCWYKLPRLLIVAEKIRSKFLLARIVEHQNKLQLELPTSEEDLMVLDESEDFCSNQLGRQCNGPNHCRRFCCNSRSFMNVSHEQYYRCNCRWAPNYDVRCQVCARQIIVHYCV